MAQDLLVRDLEQVEEWVRGVALAEEGWVEISLGQDQVGIAFAPVVEQRFLIKQERLAMI